MRAPIKLNRGAWPEAVTRLLPSTEDPRVLVRPGALTLEIAAFSRAVSVLKFGATFKTTRPGRQPIADRLVVERFAGKRPVILDIGASDGSTSLDLIEALGQGFEQYCVTDYNISVEYAVDPDGTTFFRAVGGDDILAVNDRFVVYADTEGAAPALAWASRRALARARTRSRWTEQKLVQPRLLALSERDARVVVQRHDMMQPWGGRAPDLIKIANVLNETYFSREQMRSALRTQCARLTDGGFLLLADNRGEIERLSLFRRQGGALALEQAHGGGAEAAANVPAAL